MEINADGSHVLTASLKDFWVPYLLTVPAPMLMTIIGGRVILFWIAALAVHADQTRLPLILRARQIGVLICPEMLTMQLTFFNAISQTAI